MSGTGEATVFKFGRNIHRFHLIKKPIGEKGAWTYPGTAQIFRVPPVIPGMGKATNFKFGWNIYGVHTNKCKLKSVEKGERGRIHRLSKFFGYPYYLRNR